MDDLHVNNARWESDGVRVAGCSPHAVALMLCGGTSPAGNYVPCSCMKRVGGDVAHANGRSRLKIQWVSPRTIICNCLSGIRNAAKIYCSLMPARCFFAVNSFLQYQQANWEILKLRL